MTVKSRLLFVRENSFVKIYQERTDFSRKEETAYITQSIAKYFVWEHSTDTSFRSEGYSEYPSYLVIWRPGPFSFFEGIDQSGKKFSYSLLITFF